MNRNLWWRWAAVLLVALLSAALPGSAPAGEPAHDIALPIVLATPGIAFVSDEADLRRAIDQANVVYPGLQIEFLADIVLTAPLPMLDNPDTTIIDIQGHGHTLDGNGHGPILSIGPDTWLTVERLTLTGGAATGADECGGAAFVAGLLSLRHSVISGNSATRGGGLCVIGREDHAQLTLRDTVVSGNTAQLGGGGVLAQAEDGATVHLGIYDSTLSRNRALGGDGGAIHAATRTGKTSTAIRWSAITANFALNGGGLYNAGTAEGAAEAIAQAEIYSSTFSGNVALGDGGAIANYDAPQPPDFPKGRVEVAFITITANTAYRGSGVFNGPDAFFWPFATIIAGNAPEGGDCNQRISSDGYNMDGDGSCQLFAENNDFPRGRPDLLPLALNPPGTTATHALGPASEARDRLSPDDGYCDPMNLDTDQRRVPRPQPIGGSCDIGAYEATADG